MPIFLMWASQMGSFLAQSFQFLYSNVFCALCNRGKKKKAEAAARLRRERRQNEKLAAATLATASEKIGATILEVGTPTPSIGRESVGYGDNSVTYKSSSKRGSENHIDFNSRANLANKLLHQPISNSQLISNHGVSHNNDSGLQSQQSLECANDKSVKIEILEPEMKEILESCAKYNLDQMKDPEDLVKSTEVLEEIKHAETLERNRVAKPKKFTSTNGHKNSNDGNPATSLPNSPFKANTAIRDEEEIRANTNGNVNMGLNGHDNQNGETMLKGNIFRRDSNLSFYDNSPESPLPPPNLHSLSNKENSTSVASTIRASSSSGTPPPKRKSKLSGNQSNQLGVHNGYSNSANQLVVTANPYKNGAPVTSLLKSPGIRQNSYGNSVFHENYIKRLIYILYIALLLVLIMV